MSVFVSSLIWRHFPEGGGKMTTALALADIADDQGRCIYDDSSALALAKKTIQSERAVKYHLSAMIASGWLEAVVNERGGRGNKATHRIPVELIPRSATGRVQKLQPLPVQQDPVETSAQPVVVADPESLQKLHGLSDPAGKGADSDTKGANPDTKGCKTQHPSNKGYVVHKNTVGESADAASPIFIQIPLLSPKDAPKFYGVTEAQVAEWTEAFPAIDVRQKLRDIQQWNKVNESNRKTVGGILKHVVRWLTKEQNSARPGQAPASAPKAERPLTCEANIAGQPCGMPAKNHGGVIECEGCYTKRISNRGIPAAVRAKLGLPV